MAFKLHIPAFLVALFIGLFYVYIATPHRRVVIKQPTIDNAGKIKYMDDDRNCYVLDAEKTECKK